MQKIKISLPLILSLTSFYLYAAEQFWTGAVNNMFQVDGNWDPGPTPIFTDIAIFDGRATGGEISVEGTQGAAQVAGIEFRTSGSEAPYTIYTPGGAASLILFSGTVSNTSGVTQTIEARNLSQIEFRNNSVASNPNTMPILYKTPSSSGTFFFRDNSNAGNGTFQLADGSLLIFENASDGGTANVQLLADAILYPDHAITIGSIASDTNTQIYVTDELTLGNSNDQEIGGFIFENTVPSFINKQGSGTVTISAQNFLSGGLNIAEGTIAVGADNNIGGVNAPIGLDGGTLSILNTFSTSRSVNISANNGGINTNANNFTVSGIVSGLGSLAKDGSGTLFLTNAGNNYSGGTIINAGILSIGANTDLGNAASSVTLNSGTLQITNSITLPRNFFLNSGNGSIDTGANNVEISGDLSGIGGFFTKIGSGDLTLSGISTYSGGTTVSAGILAGTTNSIQGNILNNATVVFDQVASGTYSGNMSGSGNVRIDNGVVTFSGINTYAGGTLVQGDSSLIGTTLSLHGDMNLVAGTLTFQQVDTGTYFEDISGAGDVIVQGGGVVTFSGINTYSGGTVVQLDTTLIGNTSNLQGNIVDNGQVVFDQAVNGTYSGIISGSGEVTVQGTGTITFTGTNTYIGGTLIQGSSTLLGSTVSVQGNIANNSHLVFDQGFDGEFSGDITGMGDLTLLGGETLTLSGFNSYSGGTLISLGELEGTTISLQGDIANNDALLFDQGFDGIFSGSISGTGEVFVTGGGTITFDGINSYTGGTILSGVTLIGDTSNLIGTIDLFSNSSLEFNQTSDGIFNGELVGDSTNNLLKTGMGTLTINTDNSSFFGDTTIFEGKISLNATIGGNVFVPSGTLGGVGTVDGNLEVTGTGTVAPANSIGVLNVLGNYLQTDGTLTIHIDGTGQSSLLNVAGSATIGGDASLFVISDDGKYLPNFDYHFLTASGGISGNFANASSANPLFFPEISFNDALTEAFFSFAQSLANVASTFNETQIAAQLDSIDDPTPAQAELLSAFLTLSVEEAQDALNQMTGQQYTNLLARAELANRQFLRQLYNPLRENLTLDPYHRNCGCGVEWTTWTSGSIGRGLFDSTSEVDRVSMNEYEVALGAQASLNNTFTIGVAISYLRDDVHYHVGGNGENNAILGALYGLYHPIGYYFLLELIAGQSNDNVHREIVIGDLIYKPSRTVGILQTAAYAETGIDWSMRYFFTQPFIGIEVDYIHQEHLIERTGTPLDMTFNSRSYTSAFGRLGTHLTPIINFCGLYITLDAAFDFRFTSTRNRIDGFFNDFGTDFTIIGADLNRFDFEGSVFISKNISRFLEIFLEGRGFIGNRNSGYEGTLGLIWSW